MTPVKGTTVPRAELQGLTVLSRLLLVVTRALPDTPARVVMIGDSTCCVAALEKTGGLLNPFFSNRVAEVHENMDQIGQVAHHVEPVWHVRSSLNPADIATRGHAAVSDVDRDSVW